MEIVNYVRTKNGEIGKLVNVEVYYVLGQYEQDKYSCVLFNNSYIPCVVSNDFIIKKGQLIDLIEVGDYVNGYLVKDIDYAFDDVIMNKKNARYVPYIDCNKNNYIDDIKSIVTKEQFESMEYKVGD